jgi:hypothetical protein
MNQSAEFVVGLSLRRAFRRRLRSDGLEFTEDRGWLDSQFIVHGTHEQLTRLLRLVQLVESV